MLRKITLITLISDSSPLIFMNLLAHVVTRRDDRVQL